MAMPIHERRALEKNTKNSTTKTASPRKAAQEAADKRRARAEEIATLQNTQANLVERLDLGAARIEEARSQGRDVTSWEDYWIQLLRDYERVCERLRDLEAEAALEN